MHFEKIGSCRCMYIWKEVLFILFCSPTNVCSRERGEKYRIKESRMKSLVLWKACRLFKFDSFWWEYQNGRYHCCKLIQNVGGKWIFKGIILTRSGSACDKQLDISSSNTKMQNYLRNFLWYHHEIIVSFIMLFTKLLIFIS